MKKNFKAMLALVLAFAMGTTGAFAYDYPEMVAPGSTISFGKSDFYDKKDTGDVIPPGVKLNSSNFTIYKKSIKTGANLVDDIKINSRAEEVQIVLNEKAVTAAPTRPNIVISELSVRATKTVREDGETIMKSGTIYTFGDVINIRAGLETEEMEINRDGVDLWLESGESKYVRWIKGDGDGPVYVSYGDMAVGECRVYSGDRVLYYYDDEVDAELEDANPDAYITSLNLGSGSFEASLKLQILGNKSDYIYEYSNGKLTAAKGLKWSSSQEAWTATLSKGKHFIISDIKLRGITGTTGGGTSVDDKDYDYDDEESSSSAPSYNNPYQNPETGGGSNLAVSISAIVAIVAIAVLSIIMSTILAVKKK